MDMHRFNINGSLNSKEYHKHLVHSYGVFDFDIWGDECLEIIEWCKENCIGKFGVFDTAASYVAEGVKDVSVFGFVEETDAMAFKLMWC